MSRKTTAKSFAVRRRKRRQWLTFIRMIRYGVNNFSRNAWLTVAATTMMTLTLLVIMTTVMARNVLQDSVSAIKNKVDVSIYIKPDAAAKDIKKMKDDITNLPNVRKVEYLSSEESRKAFTEKNKNNRNIIDALTVSNAQFPGAFRVNLADINDSSALKKYVETDPTLKANLDEVQQPALGGDKAKVIERIGSTTAFAEKAGLIMSVVLVIISSLIVFNTIRMAIFNRREEIQMMKLIGADKGFIRGPFIVEAIVYGFIAALLATGLGVLGLILAQPKLEPQGIVVDPTMNFVTVYIGFVLLAMIVLGAVIGIISSLFATAKYLKI
jgi:cell division transport system permease protein